jgi:hypothetical protein
MPMHDPLPIYALLTAIAAAVIASIATSVRVLPEMIDVSIVPTCSGLGSLALTTYGALRQFDPDRIGRLALAGTVIGGLLGIALMVFGLLIEVL